MHLVFFLSLSQGHEAAGAGQHPEQPARQLPETIFNGLDDLAGVSLQFSEFRRFPRNLIRGKQKLLHFWSYYLANNADLDSSNPLVIPEVG